MKRVVCCTFMCKVPSLPLLSPRLPRAHLALPSWAIITTTLNNATHPHCVHCLPINPRTQNSCHDCPAPSPPRPPPLHSFSTSSDDTTALLLPSTPRLRGAGIGGGAGVGRSHDVSRVAVWA